MWTPATRREHSRDHLRYGSDLTDAEWALLEPHTAAAGQDGPAAPVASMREILNAIFYVLRAGCAWRLLPKCFPPMTTVYRWFLRFRREGLFETINHHLAHARSRAGRTRGQPLGGGDRQPERQNRRKPAGRAAMTPPRRSRAESATPWSTPTAAPSCSRPTPAYIQDRDGARASAQGFAQILSLRRARVRRQRLWLPKEFQRRHLDRRRSRQENRRPGRLPASCPVSGSSSASSPGSIETAALPKTSRATIASAEAFLYAASVMLLTRRLAAAIMSFESDFRARQAEV